MVVRSDIMLQCLVEPGTKWRAPIALPLRCFGQDVRGPRYPFGAAVIYKTTPYERMALAHTCHNNCEGGVFMGFAQQHGGGWARALLVALADQLRKASRPNHVHLRRTPHRQLSLVFNKTKTPHDTCPVFTKALARPPSHCLEKRLKTVNLRQRGGGPHKSHRIPGNKSSHSQARRVHRTMWKLVHRPQTG